MKLYVVRHAEALSQEKADINSDADRPLTEYGHAQCRALAPALLAQGVTIEVILTSPYLRARQTAQGLVDHWLDPKPRIEECEELAPSGSSGKLARTLRKMKVATAALVGHMPDLAEHLAWFVGSKKARLEMDKAGVAFIECDDLPDKGSGSLRWLVTPKWYMSS
jgi:phosphohistidine phosphatase